MRARKRGKLVLFFATGLTLGGLVFCGTTQVNAASDNVPQTITTNNAAKTWVTVSQGKLVAQYDGQWKAGQGYHRVNVIKEKGKSGRDAYVFCIDWSKESPSNKQLQRQLQANPAVQWLITDFSKGHHKSFESIAGVDNNDYDLADYWLYQTVIHMVASPNSASPIDGNKPDANLDKYDPKIRSQILRLKAEALKHKSESDSEIVLNSAKLEFDPSSLNLGYGDLHGDKFEKDFTTKSKDMHDIQVHAQDSKYEKYLSGTRKNGSKVDFQNVNDGDKLKVSIPYQDAGKELNFKVKATGHWNKRAKVAWVYGDNDPKTQKVAKSVVRATTVPLNAQTEMNVRINPAFGKLTFIKKGTGNDNKDVLEGTQFELTADGGFSQTQTAGKDGRVTFNNLPLGKKYHLKEIKQPNQDYNGTYDRDITELTGSNPQREVDLGTVLNKKRFQHFDIHKKNVTGAGIEGSQFVLIQKDFNAPLDHITIEEAKKQAMRQVNGELVSGHSDQSPYIATTDKNGNTSFDKVLVDDNWHTYYAVEIKSPNGYSLNGTPIKLGDHASSTSPTRISGEMTDTVQPIPTTGSNALVIEAIALTTIVTIVVGYGYHESKKAK